jgi:hypothetical protein
VTNGEAVEVPLRSSGVALVSKQDEQLILSFSWYAKRKNTNTYAVRYVKRDGRSYPVSMHRTLFPDWPGDIDHINRNGLDNRRENLRLTDRSVNILNCRPHRDSTTGIKGVGYDAARGKWTAALTVRGKRVLRVRCDTIEEAERAYNEARAKHCQ